VTVSAPDFPTGQFPQTEQLNAPRTSSPHQNDEPKSAVQECDDSRIPTAGRIALELEDPAVRDRVECLIAAPLFSGLSRAECLEVANSAKSVCYSHGQTIFLQDDPVRHVYVVATGMVKVTQVSKSGKETLLRVERTGSLVDDVTGASQLHSLTARAMGSCCLLVWEASLFDSFSQHIVAIQRNATEIMRSRLRSLQERFCDVTTQRVPQRLARLVIQLAAEETPGEFRPIVLSREELAQMVGTSQFTVSRLLSSWADSDILTLDRKEVVIEDLPRLLELGEAA
jgi:CRP/FNR family transcriptional regulator, nitrogen oxide reductase regulator